MIESFPGWPRASALCVIVAFLLAGFFAVRNVSSWPARISYPGEESYEGCALAETARLGQGVPIYAPPSAEGFAGATYGPLYFLLGSRLIHPNNPSYFPLRILSALAILGCMAGCSLLAFWLARSIFAACLAALVFLSYGIVTYHGVSALSDNVALFLFFCGFLVAYRFRNNRAVLLAVPLMTLGFYYKQQFIAGPLALFAYLLLEKRYVRAAQFAGTLAACGLGMFAFFQWIVFRGQEFWRHFLFFQSTLFSWHQFKLGIVAFAFIFAAPLLLGFEYLRTHPDKLIHCYLVSAIALGLVSIAKESAFIQYFYESILLISVLVPALLASLLAQQRGVLEVAAVLTFALVAGQWYTPPAPKPTDVSGYDAVQAFFRTHFPPHARALGFRGGDLIQAGFDTPFADLFQTELLARRHVISDQDLIARIRTAWFSVIVLDFNLAEERDPLLLDLYLNEDTRQAIEENYTVVEKLKVPSPERLPNQQGFYIYVPQHPQVSSTVASASLLADAPPRAAKEGQEKASVSISGFLGLQPAGNRNQNRLFGGSKCLQRVTF
jgi:hypothetical protein